MTNYLLSQASLAYQDNILFKNLDVPFFKHQWTVILGPSGVGKSCLLRLIAGLEPQGEVQYRPPSQCISYLPQFNMLLPWLSVLDNVLLGPTLRGEKISPSQKNTALNILKKLGLNPAVFAHRKPYGLSGGQQKRVALARALFENKAIFLMDEPLTSLDALTQRVLQKLFKQWLQKKTVIWVTHDPREALALGDHLYVLSGSPAVLQPVERKNEKALWRMLAFAHKI